MSRRGTAEDDARAGDPGATVLGDPGATVLGGDRATVSGGDGRTATGDSGATFVGGPDATVAGDSRDADATVVGDADAAVVVDPGATVMGGGTEAGPAQGRAGGTAAARPSGPDDEDVPVDLVPGQLIAGTYQVVDLLGRGGMGAVHRVRHLEWDVELAVKTPLPDIVAARGLEDFVAEASTWVDVGLHPNVVACHYVRVLGGIPRVFAEYVAGGSLERWIVEGRFRGDDETEVLSGVIDSAIQVAWGLHHAHRHGLVHQDVKPANVLMTPDGTAKVTDLGLAGATVRGRTPAYAAPEQRAGATVTAAADIYGFGLTLLHLLWGDRTWLEGPVWADAAPGDLIGAAPPGARATLPRELAELIAACLVGAPEGRPADLSVIAAWLAILYEEIGGRPYPRGQPPESELLAASLNNTALSLLDLGRRDEGLDALRRSLVTDPHFPEAVYNEGLLSWNRGEIGDRELVGRLVRLAGTAPDDWRAHHLIAEAHLARQDVEASRAALLAAERLDAPPVLLERVRTRLDSAEGSHATVLFDLAAHVAGVRALACGPGAGHVTSVAEDGGVVTWDAATAGILSGYVLPSLPAEHSHVIFTADATGLLYTPHLADDAGPAGVWLIRDGSRDPVRLGTENGEALAVSRDGRWALLQHAAGPLEPSKLAAHGALSSTPHFVLALWDLHDSGALWESTHGARYTVCADLSPDGRLVCCSDTDGRLRTLDVKTGEPVWCIDGLPDTGRFLRWFDAASVLLCHAEVRFRRRVTCLDPRTGSTSFTLDHDDAVGLAVPARSGTFVVSGTSEGNVHVWNPRTGVLLRTFELWGTAVAALAAQGLDMVAAGSGDGRLAVIRLPSDDEPELHPALARVVAPAETYERVAALESALNETRSALAVGAAAAALETLRSAREDAELVRHPAIMELWQEVGLHGRRVGLRGAWLQQTLEGHDDAVLSLAISPDGDTLLSGGGPPVERSIRELQQAVQRRTTPEDFRLRLWRLPTGELLRTLDGHTDTVRAVTFVDGSRAASAGDDGLVLRWELDGGSAESEVTADVPLVGLQASRAGRFLASSDREDILRLHVTGCPGMPKELVRPPESRHPFAPHPATATLDGRVVARATEDGGIILWMPLDGRSRDSGPRPGAGEMGRLAFSPDGRRLAAGRADGGVVLWDAESLEIIWEHAAHGPGMLGMNEISLDRPDASFRKGQTPAVAFSADGRFVASGGADRLVRLWEVVTGECLTTLQGHDDEVAAVVFSPGGAFLASGGWDGRVIVWQLDWDYEVPDAADWDEAARPFVDAFLDIQRPVAADGIGADGAPRWDEADLDRLMTDLGRRGFGWLSREGVGKQLERTGQDR